jgi:hypothetical protein
MELHPSVTEFFHGAVTDSLSSLKIEASEPTEFYLVNLLVEFTKSNKVDESPIALKMAQISNASPDEKVRGLKEIGDTSLYMSGFFADALNRRLVDVNYYIAMGGSAYGQLATLVSLTRGGQSQLFREVYQELSARFGLFVDVLQQIRRSTAMGVGAVSGANVVRLYEEWVKTGSEWLEKKLRESGVILSPTDKKQVH